MVESNIYIGASGWSYPTGEGTWKGYFYPNLKKLDELAYYSQFFKTVEVNSSFYRPPEPRLAESWARRTPDGFLFTVKLWQKFTHPRMFKAATGEEAVVCADDVELFRRGIEPLASRGKLGALLAQFPPSCVNDGYGRQILQAVIKCFGDYRLAVELRHKSWSDDRATAELLRERNAAWVQIDEPQFGSSISPELPVTSDMAYFRFHGRNKENWWKGNVETRYAYLYSAGEIEELSARVSAAAQKTKLLFAFFNNHWKACAPRNAVDLMRALQLPFRELPRLMGEIIPEE
ncbi:MAG: DUF72 domain-containing protein [Chloroflexi bacterium]|nr:DUF72 domain-containing protein [Chloroflexota bacterium]